MSVLDAEVICHFDTKGNIIPLRIRVEDEEHIKQTFAIKSYKPPKKQLEGSQGYLGGFYQVPGILDYECKIEVLGIQRIIILKYFIKEKTWKVLTLPQK